LDKFLPPIDVIGNEYKVIRNTTHERLSSVAGDYGDAPAIQNAVGASLSYKDLVDQIEYTVVQLNRCGVSRNERVAIVLPQSP
jgi:non-ribosomal peptide synthetase component E (peptide arylation enzyme)